MVKFFKKKTMRRALEEALADGVLTDEEVSHLSRLQSDLGISDDAINAMRKKHAAQALAPFIDKISQSFRFSPEDEAALMKVCGDLKISPELGDGVEFAREIWKIENEPAYLPEMLDTDLVLKKGEAVYAGTYCDWEQYKKRRTSRAYGGASVGFRVAKGVTLRFGQYQPMGNIVEELSKISSGRLFLTNKRLTFVGERRSTNITFGRLATFELYSDGMVINKTSGPPDYFLDIDKGTVEYMAALIQRFAYA